MLQVSGQPTPRPIPTNARPKVYQSVADLGRSTNIMPALRLWSCAVFDPVLAIQRGRLSQRLPYPSDRDTQWNRVRDH